MPRRHQPPSLRQSSLLNIACHFESYWCVGNQTSGLDYRNLSKCVGPFEYLGDDMIQELLEVMDEKNLLRTYHFRFLLGSNIRHFKLSHLLHENDFYVVQTIAVRCQKLTHLNISGRSTVNEHVLCDLVTNLPQLVSLDLDRTRTNLTVLNAVAEHCPKLLELYISWTISIRGSDYDVREFAILCKKLGHPQLNTIAFEGNMVSVNTVVTLLTSQKKLQSIIYSGSIHTAFDMMYGEEFRYLQKVPSEWIRTDISVIKVDAILMRANLELTFKFCPFVTDLRLHVFSPESARYVCLLRHVKVLYMKGDRYIPMRFRDGVLPIILELDENLISLSLENISEVSVMPLGELCPKLKTLIIVDSRSSSSDANPMVGNPIGCFTNLKELKLRNGLTDEDILAILVNASKLRNVEITQVDLTDDTISKANLIHGFRHLEEAGFYGCRLISVQTVDIMLSSDNPLRHLTFLDCQLITSDDKERLIQKATRMGLSIIIDIEKYRELEALITIQM